MLSVSMYGDCLNNIGAKVHSSELNFSNPSLKAGVIYESSSGL